MLSGDCNEIFETPYTKRFIVAIAAAIASMAGPVHAQTSGDGALSDGNGAVASGDYSVAIGTAVTSAGPRSLSFGYASTAAGADSIVLGTSSTAQTNAVAVGNTTAAGTNATAMGSAATAAGNGSVAIGTGAVANNSQDVAIGSGSTTGAAHPLSSFVIAGENYSVAGSTSNGVVSFGAPQSPRQLTNAPPAPLVQQVSTPSTDPSSITWDRQLGVSQRRRVSP